MQSWTGARLTYVKVGAADHHYDPSANGHEKFSLVFNRMSPSAWNRGRADNIFYTLNYLAHLEQQGTRVVNGSQAFRFETSKALQLSLLQSLGLPYPRSRVIHRSSEAPAAAAGLRFPVVVKPNIGGSGAGIIRFDTPSPTRKRGRQRHSAGFRRHGTRTGIHSRERWSYRSRGDDRL